MDTRLDLELPLMTVEEFLATDQCVFGEGRFELVDGRVVAMAPTSGRHGDIVINIANALTAAIKAAGLPCRVRNEPGVRAASRPATARKPDLGVICRDPPRYLVLVEVRSPSNRGVPYEERIRDLEDVDSVEEIIEVEQSEVLVRVLRRAGDGWQEEKVRGDDKVLELRSLGIEVAVAEFYANLFPEVEFP